MSLEGSPLASSLPLVLPVHGSYEIDGSTVVIVAVVGDILDFLISKASSLATQHIIICIEGLSLVGILLTRFWTWLLKLS